VDLFTRDFASIYLSNYLFTQESTVEIIHKNNNLDVLSMRFI